MSDQLSADPALDEPLTLMDLLKTPDPMLSVLYPDTPPSYFADKGDVFTKPKNPIERYQDAPIKPYIKTRDFNNSEDEPYLNKPKPGIEIGIKVSF